MSLYRRKDSPFWWVKLPQIRGESRPLQQSTGTADKRQARQVHDRLAAARWEQDRLGVKPRHTWEEAVVRWLWKRSTRPRTQMTAKLRWLDRYLGGLHLDEIDRTLIDRIKFDREKIASAGTTNRYLALIRSILRRPGKSGRDRSCAQVQVVQAEGRVRSLSPAEFERCTQLPAHLVDMARFR